MFLNFMLTILGSVTLSTPQTKEIYWYWIAWYNLPLLGTTTSNTPLSQLSRDTCIAMSFRCDHGLKQLVNGFSSFHFDTCMTPRPRLGTIYLVELGSSAQTDTCWTGCPSEHIKHSSAIDFCWIVAFEDIKIPRVEKLSIIELQF